METIDIVKYILDDSGFKELEFILVTTNRLDFPGYSKKINTARYNLAIQDTVKVGTAFIGGINCMICINTAEAFGGTIGQVEGEKVARALDIARKRKIPFVCFLNSGGARIQEGVLSLIQMTKIISAVQRYKKKRVPLISVICNYVYGGIFASLVGVSDIVIMEERSKLGFSGKRVIETTYNIQCTDSFQGSSFCLKNGLVDIVVSNKNELREIICKLLKFHRG